MRLRLLAAVALLCLGSMALAQTTEPVLYLGDFNITPGKEKDFLDLVNKYDKPTLDTLTAEGAVMAWGIDAPLLHQPGASSMELWWFSPDMGALDKVFAAFDALEKKMAADDEAAAKAAKAAGKPAPKTTLERFLGLGDFGKHADTLYRVRVFEGRPAGSGVLPYIWVTSVRVTPGNGPAFRATWDKYIRPVYQKLLTEGVIVSYGLADEEVKSTDAFTHIGWATLPNLAAREKVRAAFDAAPEAERHQRSEDFLKALDPTATRSFVLRSVMFNEGPPPKK